MGNFQGAMFFCTLQTIHVKFENFFTKFQNLISSKFCVKALIILCKNFTELSIFSCLYLQVPVGVGQYNIDRIEQCWNRNGNCSVFISKHPLLPPKVDSPRERMLKERITPRGVTSSLQKEFLIPLSRPRNCITSCIS